MTMNRRKFLKVAAATMTVPGALKALNAVVTRQGNVMKIVVPKLEALNPPRFGQIEFYVDPSSMPGGDGSIDWPFRTMNEAMDEIKRRRT